MLCPTCKQPNPDEAKFCMECGFDLSAISSESAVEKKDSIGQLATRVNPGKGKKNKDVSIGDGATRGPAPEKEPTAGEPVLKTLSGRYELQEEIGRGGFAVVYRSHDSRLDRTVAVKCLCPSEQREAMPEQEPARFKREVQSIVKLKHRNIVQVYDHDQDQDGYYIVMEYFSGGSLRQLLGKQKKLPVEEAVCLIQGVCQGLAYAHRKNLVHRDIKPDNIMLAEEEGQQVPKIVDFGLARDGQEIGLSMTGYGMGTPLYMSPEQRRDAKSVNHTTDIYAVGKTLYELVTGEVPDSVDPEVLEAYPELSKIIFKCVKLRPEERYFSMDDLHAALDDLTFSGTVTAQSKDRLLERNTCASCGATNQASVKFCHKCGSGMTRDCPECEVENSIHATHCGDCGTDVDGVLLLKEVLPRIEQYQQEKKWSRIIKEVSLADLDVNVSGEKGEKLLASIKRIDEQAHENKQQVDELKPMVEQGRQNEEYEGLLEKVVQLSELTPDDESLATLQAQLEELEGQRHQYLEEAGRAFEQHRYLQAAEPLDRIHDALQAGAEVVAFRQKIKNRVDELNEKVTRRNKRAARWKEQIQSLQLPDQAVSIHGGPVESYDFHGLELLQSMVEARRGGEAGVSQIQFFDSQQLDKAIQLTEKMTRIEIEHWENVELTEYAQWAISKRAELRVHEERENQLRDRLVELARQHQQGHDYEAALSELEKIPVPLRTDAIITQQSEIAAIREELSTLQEEVSGDIENKPKEALLRKTTRYLELNPGDSQVKELHEQLSQWVSRLAELLGEAKQLFRQGKYNALLAALNNWPEHLERPAELEEMLEDATTRLARARWSGWWLMIRYSALVALVALVLVLYLFVLFHFR